MAVSTFGQDWISLLGSWSTVAILLLIASGTSIAVYRLLISPLAKIPGPKLAALTILYEFYYTIIKDGQWGKEVDRMHAIYGPVVRVNPWEVSVRDPAFYNELYVGSSVRRSSIWARGRQGNGFEGSHHLSVPHELHRQRRKHLEWFFSKSNTDRLHDVIVREARLLDDRLTALRGGREVVNLDHAFTALTGDIIGQVSCGSRLDLLADKDFSPDWHGTLIKAVLVAPVFKSFSWLSLGMKMIPASVLEKVYPAGVSSKIMGETGAAYIQKIKNEIATSKGDLESLNRKSVFHHLLVSNIPEEEKSNHRLQAEAMIMLIAGSITSAHTISLIVYHVLTRPHINQRLQDEIRGIWSGNMDVVPAWGELEKLPYLQACIKEALRLNGLVGNLVRISPDEPLVHKQIVIPAGTPVGMSIYHMHTNPQVWEQPLEFLPDRWLVPDTTQMDRNYVPFAKGSRSCLGLNLAMAELYIITATIFRPNGPSLKLFQTDRRTVEFTRDYVMGMADASSKGVRVTVE